MKKLEIRVDLKSQIQNDFPSNIGRIIDRIRQRLVHSANQNPALIVRWITKANVLFKSQFNVASIIWKFFEIFVGFVEFDECSKNNFQKLFLIDDPKIDYLEMDRLNKL